MKRMWKLIVVTVALLALAVVPAYADDGGQIITGRDFVVTPSNPVHGYLVVLGGRAEIQSGGTVGGNLAVFGGKVVCAGRVYGDVFVLGGDVTLEPTAIVDGDVAAVGGNVNRMPGAQVSGEVRSDLSTIFTGVDFSGWSPSGWRWDGWSGPNWTNLGGFAANFLAVLLAVLAVVLLPKNVQRVRESIVAAPWASLGVGFLALIVVAVVGGLLIITICLALFGGLLLLAAWIAGMLGLAALGLELGERLLRAFGAKVFAPALAVLLGAFVLVLLTYLPCCIGALIWVALASASLGAAILSRFGSKVYTPSAGAPAAGTGTPAA